MSRTFIITKYLGIPYKEKGRTIEGLDCLGLIIMIYRDLAQVEIPDLEDYDMKLPLLKKKDYIEDNYKDYYIKHWERVDTPSLLDIVLIKNGKNIPNHAGVVLDTETFIHCIKAGVVVSRLKDKLWKNRITGYFRYKR